MAEFCNQCAKYWDLPPDFVGLTPKEAWADGKAVVVLCEGCGVIQVDPEGNCVSEDCLCNGHKGGRDTWNY